MRYLLRVTAVVSLLWALALLGGLDYAIPENQQAPLVVALSTELGVAALVFAFVFWRAGGETPPNRTVIYAAILLLVFKVACGLYAVLVLFAGTAALVCLADLVASITLAVGMIEALPRALCAPKH